MRIAGRQQEHWALFRDLQAGYAIFASGCGEIMVGGRQEWDSRNLYPVKNRVTLSPNIAMVMVCIARDE